MIENSDDVSNRSVILMVENGNNVPKNSKEKTSLKILLNDENFIEKNSSLLPLLIPKNIMETWDKYKIGILTVSNTTEIAITKKNCNTFCGQPTFYICKEGYSSVKSHYLYSESDFPYSFIIVDLKSKTDNNDVEILIEQFVNSILHNGRIPIIIINKDDVEILNIIKKLEKSVGHYYLNDISGYLNALLEIFPIEIQEENSSELLINNIKDKKIPCDLNMINKFLNLSQVISKSKFHDVFDNVKYSGNLISHYINNNLDLDKRNIEEVPGLNQYIKKSIKSVIKQFSGFNPEKPPEGVLLYGPPGTGKTMLASIIANSCNRNFIKASVSEWLSSGEAHMGTTIKAMKSSFKEARENAPSILFIDELDSLGARDTGDNRSDGYFSRIINSFIEEVQGISNRGDIAIIGATNFIDKIDPAIKRKKRLGNHIEIGYPDFEGRIEILKYYMKDLENYADVASRIGKSSPADIEAFSDEVTLEKEENPDVNINILIDNVIMNTLYKKYPDINYNAIRYQLALGIIGQAFVYKTIFPHKKINYLSIKPGLNYFAICDVEEMENHNALDEYHNLMYQIAPFEIRKIYQNKKIKGFDYRKIILPKLYNLDNYKKYMKEHLENSGFNKKNFFDNQNIQKGYKIIKNVAMLKDNKFLKIIPSHINTFLNILDVFVDFSDEKFSQDIIKKAEKDIEKILIPEIKNLSQIAFILEREEVLTGEQFNQLYYQLKEQNPSKIELVKKRLHYKKS